jgi:hypothetical protein
LIRDKLFVGWPGEARCHGIRRQAEGNRHQGKYVSATFDATFDATFPRPRL